MVDEAAGDFTGDLDAGGDFVGDLAGPFSAMSRTGAAADRFVGVRGVDFACGGVVAAAAVAEAVRVLDFGVAPFAVEFCLKVIKMALIINLLKIFNLLIKFTLKSVKIYA